MILDNTTALYQEQLEEAASDAASILMEGSFEELPHDEQVMVQHLHHQLHLTKMLIQVFINLLMVLTNKLMSQLMVLIEHSLTQLVSHHKVMFILEVQENLEIIVEHGKLQQELQVMDLNSTIQQTVQHLSQLLQMVLQQQQIN